jgi:hypothetical protein
MKACLPIILLALSTGCAFGNRHVNLSYPPARAGATPHPSDSAVPSSTAESGPATVVLVDFLDQRPKKTTVGDVHNGFGMHTADVIAQNSVPEWVASAVALELQRAGFRVIRVRSVPSAADNSVITGEVLTAYCASWTKYEGDVSFAARVEYKGKEVLHKTYQGKIDSMTNWGASSKSYGLALSLALESAAQGFAAELRRDLPATLPR